MYNGSYWNFERSRYNVVGDEVRDVRKKCKKEDECKCKSKKCEKKK